MTYNIIGAGRLGKNIASALSTTPLTKLDSICNRSIHSSRQACNEIGFGAAIGSILELPKVNVTLITCNDDTIESIVYYLTQNPILKPGSIVVHCSGALSSAVLSPLRQQNCSIASFHPLKAFRTGYLDKHAFNQVDCVIEGDADACNWLATVFRELGTNIISLRPEAKLVYHAAATIASNYLITLANSSEELLLQAGMTQQQARSMICNLMKGNIENLTQTEHIAESLTGPLTRGDTKTLALHLQAIENPAIKELYKVAGLTTLSMTSLSEEKKEIIRSILK